MATPFNLVSRDAQLALTEFSSQFDAALALADPDPWSKQFGLTNSSRAIRTVYPIPVSAAGYVERKGDDKLRSLFERSVSMKPKEWTDGVADKAMIIEAPDFIGWAGEPARIAREGARQPNKLIAALLAANANLGFYRDENLGTDLGIALFAGNHPVNIFDDSFGTFDNDHTASAIDADMLSAAKRRFRSRKGPNGEPMGLELTHILVPGALEEQAKDFLESDLMINAMLDSGTNTQQTSNNRHKGTVKLVVGKELLNEDEIFLLDGSAGCYPWILQDGGAPEEIQYTKDDELYKNTGKIGVKYVLLMAAAGALPHAIERVTLS